jgi:hypothetical protein
MGRPSRTTLFAVVALLIWLSLLGGCKADHPPVDKAPEKKTNTLNVSPPEGRKEIVDPNSFPPEVQTELNADAALNASEERSVKKLPRESREKIDQCFKAGDAAACEWAQGRALNDGRTDPTHEIRRKLFKRGCALGHLTSCRQYAGSLTKNPNQYDEAMFLHKLNCEIGLIYSCEDVGNLLLLRGKEDEAREAYFALCTNEETRSCEAIAKLAKTPAGQSELKKDCDSGQNGACFAYTLTLQQSARSLMLDRCLKGNPKQAATWAVCLEAAKLIDVPFPVKGFVAQQQACIRDFEGEYWSPWLSLLDERTKPHCEDRSADYARLSERYKGNPEVLFVLQRNQTRLRKGTWQSVYDQKSLQAWDDIMPGRF